MSDMTVFFSQFILAILFFPVLWIAIGLILLWKPKLWDIDESARRSPHLPEEDMLYWHRR